MAPFSDDAGDFAARYREMTNEELLQLAGRPWEIGEDAWDALEEELESRNLEAPVPNVEVAEKRNLVVIRRFRDLPEAMLAKGKLESQGLDSFIADDNMVRMDWLWSNLVGGVKLLVDADEEEKALRVLDEAIPPEIDFEAERSIYSLGVRIANHWTLILKNYTSRSPLGVSMWAFPSRCTARVGFARTAAIHGKKIPRSKTVRLRSRLCKS